MKGPEIAQFGLNLSLQRYYGFRLFGEHEDGGDREAWKR